MAAHRYWRMRDCNNYSAGQMTLGNIWFRASVGGADVTPIAASATSNTLLHPPSHAIDGDAATYWEAASSDASPDISFDLGSAIDLAEIVIQATSNSNRHTRTVTNFHLQYSDTGISGPWTDLKYVSLPAFTTPSEIQEHDILSTTLFERATKASLLAVYNFPTEFVQATFSAVQVAENHATQDFHVTKAGVQAVVLGRVADPKIRVWTFTLDGHDFYVINTYKETLVYDFHAEEWYNWGSAELPYWFVQTGINWNANVGGLQVAVGGGELLSNVIVGDGSVPVLYWLAPEKYTDDRNDDTGWLNYQRLLHGQIAMRGRNYVPCPAVELEGSIGRTGVTIGINVTLHYSDDRGVSYVNAGALEVTEGYTDTRLAWRSLGSMTGPGRLFKIEDDGALVRIDGLDIPE